VQHKAAPRANGGMPFGAERRLKLVTAAGAEEVDVVGHVRWHWHSGYSNRNTKGTISCLSAAPERLLYSFVHSFANKRKSRWWPINMQLAKGW
jgi:hypothetical protein